jgi:hypothetical protein
LRTASGHRLPSIVHCATSSTFVKASANEDESVTTATSSAVDTYGDYLHDSKAWKTLGHAATVQEAQTLCMKSWTINPARTAAEADALVDLVAPICAIRTLGESDDFVGIEITPDRAGTIRICQECKALAFADAFCVAGEHCPCYWK